MTVPKGGGFVVKIFMQTKKRGFSVGVVFVARKKGGNRELLTGLDTRKIFPAITLVRVSHQRGA